MEKLTPMLQQYLQIKERYPDAILFFHIGDFYEMFFEDAEIGSKILEITLTSRNKKDQTPVPLCGVPYHSARPYIMKLIQAGYKVALCDQVEKPDPSKGIVKREVVQVITPGTLLEIGDLDEKSNNYLISIFYEDNQFGIAIADVSTGEMKFCQTEDSFSFIEELIRNNPRELILPEKIKNHPIHEVINKEIKGLIFNYFNNSSFDVDIFIKWANSLSIFSNNWMDFPLGIRASAGIISYIKQSQGIFPSHFRQINSYKIQDYLILDEDAKRNLEVFGTYFEGKKKGSLFGLLDETITGMGGRRLRQWLLYPLKNKEKIEERLKLVEFFYSDPLLRSELRELLEGIYDLERLGARVSFGKANPRDLIALKNSVAQIPLIKEKILSVKEEEIKNMAFKMDSLEDIHSMIDNAIIENPPISLHEGGIIKDGYNEELDELRAISKQGKQWIANYEKEQKQLTKINSLKVKYNQVIGYYIEVTKSNLSNIPKDYIRKQSLSNSERFITTKLKEYEDKVLGAQEKINNLEYEIFVDLRKRLAKEVARIMDTSHILSMIDAITSLAEVAHKYNYCKPKIVTSDELLIEQGRHPVVERLNRNERFVPNDTLMDLDNNQLLIITGPNMAGKSTYIRQVALIVLMAHMGSFVPADKAVIPLVDRIFTRVGASDNLVMGQSTFMVEMKETARILKYATPKSLVILDEIGRGTSTFDGLSIAWAVAEYLIDSPLRRCKTLFATHYHELTQLAELKRGVKNYNVAVREWNDKIIFLRKIVEGGSSRSYGIQVARLAGLPEEVIKRAREILKDLESGELQGFSINKNKKDFSQLSLFESLESNLVKEINSIDISTLTPLEALNKLYELQNKLKNNN